MSHLRYDYLSRKMVVFINILLLITSVSFAQSGNFVPSGGEASIFSNTHLSTSAFWSTERTATPGYFTAFGAALFSGATDVFNVDGYVKHVSSDINQGFTFPIGTGTDLRTLATSGNIPNGAEIASAWILGNPSITVDPTDSGNGLHSITSFSSDLLAVSNVGQWDWLVNTSVAGMSVSVSIPNMSSFCLPIELRLVGWNGLQWVNLSGNVGSSTNTENTIISGIMIDGITALGIGRGKTPDLSPTIPGPANGNFVAGAPGRQGFVQFTNGGTRSTDGVVTLRISKITNFTLTIPTVSSTSWGAFPFTVATNNGDWQITEGPFFYTITHKPGGLTPDINVGANIKIGYTISPNRIAPSGSAGNLTGTVLGGTGGDSNGSNNIVVRSFVIN